MNEVLEKYKELVLKTLMQLVSDYVTGYMQNGFRVYVTDEELKDCAYNSAPIIFALEILEMTPERFIEIMQLKRRVR